MTNLFREYNVMSIKHLLLVVFILTTGLMTAKPSINISLRRGEAAPVAGEPFYVTVILSDINGEMPKLQVPGAKTLYQYESGSSMSHQSINGHVTQSFTRTYTVTLRPEKQGKLVIPAITVGGVQSNVLSVNVGAPGTQSARTQAATTQQYSPDVDPGLSQQQTQQQNQSGPRFIGKGNDNLFMVANINKTTAYENEALVYTVKLYSSFSNIRFLGATEAPKFNGFALEEANPKVESLHFETYKGKQYACAVIARYVIFPQMKGHLTIQGNKYTVTAESRREYWDPFWGPLSYGNPVQLSVQPNDITIDVQSLPQPQPANFTGGVGKFCISASMPNTKLVSNQAASIIYTVTGSGNIKYLTLPDLAAVFPKQFDVSTPTPEVKATPNGNTVDGSVKFDCSVMSLEEGEYELPPVELVYFNPETGKYETTKSQGFRVSVSKGKGGSAASGHLLKMDDKLMPYTQPLRKIHNIFSGSAAYWLWYSISLVIALIILTGTLRYRRRHADTEGLNARRARRMADRILRHARKSLRSNDRNKFFDQTLEALWGYAAHKLRMPGSEMQRVLIESRFADHGVPKNIIDRFIGLLDRCEEAKYAGMGINMKEVYEESAETIRAIDTAFTK